jgi:hypothetical protein
LKVQSSDSAARYLFVGSHPYPHTLVRKTEHWENRVKVLRFEISLNVSRNPAQISSKARLAVLAR